MQKKDLKSISGCTSFVCGTFISGWVIDSEFLSPYWFIRSLAKLMNPNPHSPGGLSTYCSKHSKFPEHKQNLIKCGHMTVQNTGTVEQGGWGCGLLNHFPLTNLG